MTKVEFLEFIVRMANAIYKKGKSKPLAEYLDLILVKLLALVRTVKFPPYEPEDDSDEED